MLHSLLPYDPFLEQHQHVFEELALIDLDFLLAHLVVLQEMKLLHIFQITVYLVSVFHFAVLCGRYLRFFVKLLDLMDMLNVCIWEEMA